MQPIVHASHDRQCVRHDGGRQHGRERVQDRGGARVEQRVLEVERHAEGVVGEIGEGEGGGEGEGEGELSAGPEETLPLLCEEVRRRGGGEEGAGALEGEGA